MHLMILNSILESKDLRREAHLNIKIEVIIKKESLNQFRFFFLLFFSANKKKRKLLPFFMFIILESEFFWIFEFKFLWREKSLNNCIEDLIYILSCLPRYADHFLLRESNHIFNFPSNSIWIRCGEINLV